MEEILNKIIEIDNSAKQIVNFEKEKKINIDNFIETDFNTKKVVLDVEYKEEVELQKKIRDDKLSDYKSKLDLDTNQEIEKIEQIYREKENEIIESIVNSIKSNEE